MLQFTRGTRSKETQTLFAYCNVYFIPLFIILFFPKYSIAQVNPSSFSMTTQGVSEITNRNLTQDNKSYSNNILRHFPPPLPFEGLSDSFVLESFGNEGQSSSRGVSHFFINSDGSGGISFHGDAINVVYSAGELHIPLAIRSMFQHRNIYSFGLNNQARTLEFRYAQTIETNAPGIAASSFIQIGSSGGPRYDFQGTVNGTFTTTFDPLSGPQPIFQIESNGGVQNRFVSQTLEQTLQVVWGTPGNVPGQTPENPLPPRNPDPRRPWEIPVPADGPAAANWIDPEPATGYSYSSTNINVIGVTIPYPLAGGDQDFILSFAGRSYPIQSGIEFNISAIIPEGVASFTIEGIDPGAGIDPNNPRGFVTGLRFINSGNTLVLMSPLAIPEPSSILLIILAVCSVTCYYLIRHRKMLKRNTALF